MVFPHEIRSAKAAADGNGEGIIQFCPPQQSCSSRREENPSLHRKPMNSLRWIESKTVGKSANPTKFHPLPGGEGRGEGERKYSTAHRQALIFSAEKCEPPHVGCYGSAQCANFSEESHSWRGRNCFRVERN